jgi:hypothetical protein
MNELPKPTRTLFPVPGEFPIGSAESRAAVRLLAERFPRPPTIVSVYIDSKAASENPGRLHWGSIKGVPGIFERGDQESEQAFIDRVASARPPGIDAITIHSLTRKPGTPRAPRRNEN